MKDVLTKEEKALIELYIQLEERQKKDKKNFELGS